jgi:uncharacterized protein (TIGR03382 family)
MSTTKNAAHREPMSESETLRVDLQQTRQHLADTVQELSQRLNVPHRVKETAGQAGQRVMATAGHAGTRVKETAGHAGTRVKETAGHAGTRVKESAGQAGQRVKVTAGQAGEKAKQVPGAVKDLPELSKRNPKVTAAVGGALALAVAAVAWLVRRRK